jgi:proline racemase
MSFRDRLSQTTSWILMGLGLLDLAIAYGGKYFRLLADSSAG